MKSSQEVCLIFSQIKTKGSQHFPYLSRGHSLIGSLESEPHSVTKTGLFGEWQSITSKQFLRHLLIAKPRQSLNTLSNFARMAVDVCDSLKKFVLLPPKHLEFCNCLFQRSFVIRLVHKRRLPCVQEKSITMYKKVRLSRPSLIGSKLLEWRKRNYVKSKIGRRFCVRAFPYLKALREKVRSKCPLHQFLLPNNVVIAARYGWTGS